MAERGKPIPAATMVRIKKNASAFRMSLRKNAKDCGVSKATVQKYK